MINVCDPVFDTSIRLDDSCISLEGYSVENLLSSDAELRRKGFLSEYFIRPPVSLTIRFPFAFNIKYVVIGTKVNLQKSSGFQISAGRLDDNVPQKICSTVTEKDTVVFHDNSSDLSAFGGDDCDKCCFNISASRVIRGAEKCSLRIFKTRNSSIPAIGKLEVWGNISFGVPKELRQRSICRWKESLEPPKEEPREFRREIAASTSGPAAENGSNVFKICDDFLDSITFEVMTYPMVLPSGKFVDRSTLEKCGAHDAIYGRAPCDPFTGVPFADRVEPIYLPALKARIDSFLLENADNENVKRLPRAVGKRPLSFYTERQAKKSKVPCNVCNGNDNLYSLPCKHVQCKNCLRSATIRCNVCRKNFDKSQVEKYHTDS